MLHSGRVSPRMSGPPQLKFRGAQIKASGYAETAIQQAQNWDFTAKIKPQIDRAISLGANAIKWNALASQVTNGYITVATLQNHHRQVLNYCRTNRLYVYLCLYDSFADQPQQTADIWSSTMAPIMAVYESYSDIVVGYDMANEGNLNFGWPTTLTHCQTVRSLVRAAGSAMPLSMGISAGNSSQVWNSNVQALAASVDFYDFHVYWGSGDAAPSDLAGMRTNGGLTKPFVIGECGQSRANGAPARVSRYTTLGVLSALPDCYGVFAYEISDPNGSDDYGMWDGAGTQYTNVTDIFQTWPKLS